MGDPKIPDWLAAEVAEYDLDLAAPPETILDIGANIGAWTLRCKEHWPAAKVFAYEPVPANGRQFESNCAGIEGITLHSYAVRAFSGPGEIHPGDNGATCSFHNLGRQRPGTISVPCVSAAFLPSADLVKVDTEGCEVEILTALDLRHVRALVVEWHRAADLPMLKCAAAASGLELVSERANAPDGSWGVLKFARPGALRPRQRTLFLGVPVYNSVEPMFMQSLIAAVNAGPAWLRTVKFLTGDSLAPRARNAITAEFLASGCSHLLFIDSDIVFTLDQIERLLMHDELIVGGFYPHKNQGPLKFVINTLTTPQPARPDGLVQMGYMGTGCLRVAREVFDLMIARLGREIGYVTDPPQRRLEFEFWPAGLRDTVGPDPVFDPATMAQLARLGFTEAEAKKIVRRRFLSEDWYFCQRALDLGIPIWADTKIMMPHVGKAVYPLDSQKSFLPSGSQVQPPAADNTSGGVNAPAAAGQSPDELLHAIRN